MTGSTICALRLRSGLSVTEFAQLLGVHVATAYRWEREPGDVRVEPLQARLLARLAQVMADDPDQVNGLRGAVLIGGGLAGLAWVLDGLCPPSLRPNRQN